MWGRIRFRIFIRALCLRAVEKAVNEYVAEYLANAD